MKQRLRAAPGAFTAFYWGRLPTFLVQRARPAATQAQNQSLAVPSVPNPKGARTRFRKGQSGRKGAITGGRAVPTGVVRTYCERRTYRVQWLHCKFVIGQRRRPHLPCPPNPGHKEREK